MRNAALILLMAATLAGCAGAGGTSDFHCKATDDGVACKNPMEIYELTNSRDRISSASLAEAEANRGVGKDGKPAMSTGMFPNKPTAPINNPMPLLEPASVMRIWVAPYVDDKKDLHWPGLVYTEITSRKWSFGESQVAKIKPLVPLQVDAGRSDEQGENGPGALSGFLPFASQIDAAKQQMKPQAPSWQQQQQQIQPRQQLPRNGMVPAPNNMQNGMQQQYGD